MKMDTILVPTDFSTDAKHAMETAAEMALAFDARIVLLHAFSPDLSLAGGAGGVIMPGGFYVEYRDRAALEVERLAKEASTLHGLEVEGVAIHQVPWLAILEQSEALPADLIVMGTRGLTGIKHVTFGSTAERVVRKAKCPVLAVKAK
jgi:universal stress protein A